MMSSNKSQNNTENDISRAEKSGRIKTLVGNLWHDVDNMAKLWIVLTSQNNSTCSGFVTNSYGESWDSSCENSWVPVHNQWVPVQKTMRPKLRMLGLFCNQTVNLKTDSKTLYTV